MGNCKECEKPSIIIEVEGGLVTSVLATKEVKVLVVDRDCEGADPDEILSIKELLDFTNEDQFFTVNPAGGIAERHISDTLDCLISGNTNLLEGYICGECNSEQVIRKDGVDDRYPDDWSLDCQDCKNWEQVGNNKPHSFEVIKMLIKENKITLT